MSLNSNNQTILTKYTFSYFFPKQSHKPMFLIYFYIDNKHLRISDKGLSRENMNIHKNGLTIKNEIHKSQQAPKCQQPLSKVKSKSCSSLHPGHKSIPELRQSLMWHLYCTASLWGRCGFSRWKRPDESLFSFTLTWCCFVSDLTIQNQGQMCERPWTMPQCPL